ncbi:hypothetical protein [Chryseobacterium pennipullorum]|uniref:C1q domain-containing protein n=1 Tax=Chryseobacterium pennipullorum TaxID=2258963 RepID=A0A3D9ALK9_9FLAO|nr:hypothetical protein [Chryseobacterium pennipullorum]REC41866.1 hypothetical protein DRF67_20945 [Chryseobacterium pennipullorum]
MKNKLFFGMALFPLLIGAQVGVNTTTPQKTLHVNGSLQITNELNVGGNATTTGSAGTAGQVLKSNGPGAAPSWQNLAGVPNSTGAVIVVNGEFIVAQEIVVQLTADYTKTTPVSITDPIGNLNNVIIDNENRYSGNAATNSFKVSADGVYLVTMNAQLSTTNGQAPVLGIWNDTTNNWVARVNDRFTAPNNNLQTYTLLTSIPMVASDTYSFRITNNAAVTVKQLSSGVTGSGPVTQIAVRRLK